MLFHELIEVFELIDDPRTSGRRVAEKIAAVNPHIKVQVNTVNGANGSTDFIKMMIAGNDGRLNGGDAPTLGIIGRLGGVGARPGQIGAVSDADGAIVAITVGLKLIDMHKKGDILKGDVIIATHICPHAPQVPHVPVPFMGAPVDMKTMNRLEVDKNMDAILSIDATKGNEVINYNGFAISPTVKEGYILQVSQDLLQIMRMVTGSPPVTFPLATADITPYGNGLYHINSIMQPSTATDAPVVGVATTSEQIIPGIGTGVNYPIALETTARFCVEVAKSFGQGMCTFYDDEEFHRLKHLYGSMERLQTLPEQELLGGDSNVKSK